MSHIVSLARARRPARRRVGTGDLFCDVDAEEFGRTCRVRLWPDEWNVWRMFVSSEAVRDDESLIVAAVRKLAQDAARKAGGDVHDVEVTVGERTPSGRLPATFPAVFGERAQAQTWTKNCPDWFPPMRLRPGPYRSVALRFVYRHPGKAAGEPDSAPWPASRIGALGIKHYCPVDADFLLDSVWEPRPNESVPEKPTIIPDFEMPELTVPEGELTLPDIGAGIASATWPLMVLGGLVVVAAIAID